MLKNKQKKAKKIKVSLLTLGRMDWSYCSPLVKELKKRATVQLRLIATSSHMSSVRKGTVSEIVKDGLKPNVTLDVVTKDDSPYGIAQSMSRAVTKFAQEFKKEKPDILIVNGDRFETLAAVMAAHPFNITVAHIGGGERSEGVLDENMRHAITKMSHIHFTECEEYRKRVMQLGEEKKRVFSAGALSIESMKTIPKVSLEDINNQMGVEIEKDFLLITFHPVTLYDAKHNDVFICNFLAALRQLGFYCVFTYPNSDTHSSTITRRIKSFLKTYKRGCFVVSAGKVNYYNLMRLSRAVVGNSSSGIIETPFFKVPTVNIGDRQDGRLKARNILDSGYSSGEIVAAIKKATRDEFKKKISAMKNPFYNKNISKFIADTLISAYAQHGKKFIIKRFKDI